MGKTTEDTTQPAVADKAWADWAQKTDDRLAALEMRANDADKAAEKRELLGDPASADMETRLANLEKAAGIYTPMPKQKGDTWQDTDKLNKDEAAAVNTPDGIVA